MMGSIRALAVLALCAGAMAAAHALEPPDALTGKCRVAYHKVVHEGGLADSGELGQDEFLASHAEALSLCEQAASAGSTNAMLHEGLLMLPCEDENPHVRNASAWGRCLAAPHLYEIEDGIWLNPRFAYEYVGGYLRSRRALGMVRDAAESGDAEAQAHWAQILDRGMRFEEDGWQLVERDEEQALAWYEKSAKGGNPEAQAYYAALQIEALRKKNKEGKLWIFPTKKDASGTLILDESAVGESVAMLDEAAKRGSVVAMLYLMYHVYGLGSLVGRLGPSNYDKAEEYCYMALERGTHLTPGDACALELAVSYANHRSPIGEDPYKSAYWAKLLLNRLHYEILPEGIEASSWDVAALLQTALEKMSDEEKARLQSATKLGRPLACEDPFYDAIVRHILHCELEHS